MSTLAVITARSGSKGIKNKNICPINGKPMVAYTIESALESRYIDKVMVSTDSETYADIARKYGAEVPFLRSSKNSDDNAKSIDVLLEVIAKYEKKEQHFDSVILLQPTSPMRTSQNIDEAFELFYEKLADSVVSVCECEYSPLLCNTLPDDKNMYGFIISENALRRQDMEVYYRLNGAIYIVQTDILFKQQLFYGEKSYAYIMEQRQSVDIDSELDFEFVEFLMQKESQNK